jgi:hypothetical protein
MSIREDRIHSSFLFLSSMTKEKIIVRAADFDISIIIFFFISQIFHS